jgi:PHD/YefM family antitoxin component YafN of YafNO toxin-antitoxin module
MRKRSTSAKTPREGFLNTTEVRKRLSDTLNRVRYAGERVILRRHRSDLAAIVSMEDLQLLRALEDRIDLDAAKQALKEARRYSLAEVKKALGL